MNTTLAANHELAATEQVHASAARVGRPTVQQVLVAAVTRRYPLYSGCGRIANHPWVERICGRANEKIWARVTGEILAPMDDHVGRAAFYCGDLDPKVTWICRKVIQKGDTVLDIGANIGVTTVAMASMVGALGKVHSFEPNPELQLMLRQVIERNHFLNVTLHSMALGPADSAMELRVPRSNLGMGSLVRHGNPDDAVYKVPVRRLSEVVAQEGIKTIRMIKIDVEGFEADVFNGAQELLREIRPDAILFELNQERGAFGDQPVVRLLHEAGYDFLGVPQCKLRMRLNKMDLRQPLPPKGNDYLAVLRGQVAEGIAKRTGAV